MKNMIMKLDIPKDYYKEEIKNDFLVDTERKKIWAVELDLLSELLRVCNKYGLKIFADGGTMLGAVRHKGFIPWDDDIDMVMLREDYTRLCQVADAEFAEPYFFQTEHTDPGSMRGHAQLRNSNTTAILKRDADKKFQFNQGIFIDIFPMDNLPDEEKERQKFFEHLKALNRKAMVYSRLTARYSSYVNSPDRQNPIKKSFLNIFYQLYGRFQKKNPYYNAFEKYCQKYDKTPTEKVSKVFFCRYKEKLIWKAEWFDEIVYLPFEFIQIPVSSYYLDMLERIFGEWQKPVQVSSFHGDVFFDVSRPYTEYIGKDALPVSE